MQSFLSLILFVFFTVQMQAQTADTASIRGCNYNMPGFGQDLGVITRGEEVEFAGKIWSGPVSASNCQKEMFNGGRSVLRASRANFNADCRTNPGHPGDLFSWCAVVRFADTLCPHTWRVPTQQEFKDLMTTVCGYYLDSDNSSLFDTDMKKVRECVDTFSSHWSPGHYNYCDESGDIIPLYAILSGGGVQNSSIPISPETLNTPFWLYWSQSEQNVMEASTFGFWGVFAVASRLIEKNIGVTLRCIKDK